MVLFSYESTFFIQDKNTNIKANLHIPCQSNIIMASISGFSEGRYNADSNSRKLRPLITLCFHDKSLITNRMCIENSLFIFPSI